MNRIPPPLPLICPLCRHDRLRATTDAYVCENEACAARHPVVDGIPLLVEDFAAYASSERWMVLRRRDLPAETEAILDSPLTEDSAERIRARMLDCYRGAWAFPELEPAAGEFGDFVRDALSKHAARADAAIDFGCATGAHSPWLAPYAEAVAGIDLHFERARAAREDHPDQQLSFLVANAEDPPFQDGSVGLALWLNLLDSIAHPRTSLDGLLRVLSPGALVIFTSPFAYSSAHSEPSEWVGEGEFEDFARRNFDILDMRDRLPWVVPASPRRADVFMTKAAVLRKRA